MYKLLLTLILLLAGISPLHAAEYTGSVSWIYDGDTLRVDGVGKVRLLGIDTPESENSPRDTFYQKKFGIGAKRLRAVARHAKKYNIKNVKGLRIRLITDREKRDKYGRLLAYLYLPDGRLLNRILLERGMASVFRRYRFSHKDDFLAAEKKAHDAGIGLWQQ